MSVMLRFSSNSPEFIQKIPDLSPTFGVSKTTGFFSEILMNFGV